MINSLAYMGFESPTADEWRHFGTAVLGGQLVDRSDGVALRFDDYAERLVVHPGERNRVAYFGWDCDGADGLAAVIAQVRSAGLEVVDEPATAAVRHVDALASFVDPFGFRHELTTGLAVVGSFTPGREMDGGFVTGGGGLGHYVIIVPDLDAAMSFYIDTLGFRVSDHIEAGMSLRFLHCNPRHHTVALSAAPGLVGFHHLMLEVEEFTDVGRGLDIVNAEGRTLAMSLGRHTNDLMTSFYVRTPSGFEIEYGTGGLLIDDANWEVETLDAMSFWGHRPPEERLVPGIIGKASQPA